MDFPKFREQLAAVPIAMLVGLSGLPKETIRRVRLGITIPNVRTYLRLEAALRGEKTEPKPSRRKR
jgi:hypothetical protein